ncbi:MAG: signal peptidase I [Parvularculaceae bacterium]|nr:signal peptidase I [Parvularculaceae bacterium]
MIRRLWAKHGADIRFFAAAAAVFSVFQTTAYGMYYIPSESMLPTLAVGDRVVVNKYAYGWSRHSLPFSAAPDFPTADGRVFSRSPARGEVVVFRHPRTGVVMIKRVVGLGGDEIAMRDGKLFVNGEAARSEFQGVLRYKEHGGGAVVVARFEETAAGAKPHPTYDRGEGPGDEFGPVVVPQGAIFVMGDNRDNSLDSRFGGEGVGFLPVDRLIGRAETMAFSLHFCRRQKGLECLDRRWGARL